MTTPLRVLYIDDSSFDRTLVRDALEKEYGNFSVIEAASRQEFETQLEHSGYDVILSDFNILGFEGLQVLDAVRARAPQLPVIIVTGTGSEEVAVEAMKRGADDYVIKTVKHIRRLPLTIHTILDKRRLQQERERAQEALREEATITAALARVGRELISLLGTPSILERLCHLSAEVLHCECSHTLLWRPQEKAYRLIANWGYSPEQQQAVTTLEIPRRDTDEVEMRLNAGEEAIVVQAVDPVAARQEPSESEQKQQTQIQIALRRGKETIGRHACVYLHSTAITPRHLRIARGISQLASFALANAYLFEELQQANRLKADFLATMSHELRTPLNIIMGYSELLLDEMFGPLKDEQKGPLQRVDDSARNLLTLITDTLDISRLETGQLPVDIQEVNLNSLFQELERELGGFPDRPKVQVSWTIAPDFPPFHTDPIKLKIIVKNLVSNGVKFTDNGSVFVRAQAKGASAEISVADTGIGISEDILPVIFEPFRQGDSSITRRYGGVGLGLYIVRRLLDLLGGHISVESVAGQGSTFRVTLPLTSSR
ncbi:MAG: ATP-binding protein [Candidatus Binatia bacterium]